MKHLRWRLTLAWALCTSVIMGGCSTLNTAKPLSPGQHEVAATMGGPLTQVSGNYIPLPNSVIEGRSGLITIAERPLDLNYGLYLTPIAFGQMGVHVGGSYLLWDQKDRLPALSLSDRLYFFHNYFDTAKPDYGRGSVFVHQLEATLSYEIGSFLTYGGLANYADLSDLNLMLTPFLGAELPTGLDGFKLQLEARYYAANRSRLIESVKFYNFESGNGGFGMNFGFIWEIGQ
jgi:hypothetical protein